MDAVIVFLQQIINGIFDGSVLAMIAVGLAMIFGILEVVNFAHGEFYMVGAFVMYVFYVLFGLPYLLVVVVTIVVMGLFGVLSERIFIRPILRRSWEFPIIMTLALSILLQNSFLTIWGANPKAAPTFFSSTTLSLAGIYLSYQKIIVLAVCISSFLVLHLFLQTTKTGKAMRAVSQNREACEVVGIPVKKISSLTFMIGAALAGLAGALIGPIFVIFPTMGISPILKSFAVVIMGGFGNVKGAIYSAYILGMTETIAAAYVTTEFKDAIAFAMLITVLMIRPYGIFGKKAGI